jgi:hypothetical protein
MANSKRSSPLAWSGSFEKHSSRSSAPAPRSRPASSSNDPTPPNPEAAEKIFIPQVLTIARLAGAGVCYIRSPSGAEMVAWTEGCTPGEFDDLV